MHGTLWLNIFYSILKITKYQIFFLSILSNNFYEHNNNLITIYFMNFLNIIIIEMLYLLQTQKIIRNIQNF